MITCDGSIARSPRDWHFNIRILPLGDFAMKRTCILSLIAIACFATFAVAAEPACEDGFVPIFDGKTLDGWDGNPAFWSVEDGAIVGQTTADNPTKGNTFLIWRGGTPADFELILDYKLTNHNSGVQYRSFEVEGSKWVIGGYQADIAENKYHGIMYGERFRGILCHRGQQVTIGPNHKPQVTGSLGDSDELLGEIKQGEWNTYHIVAKGWTLTQSINGTKMVEVTDADTEMRRADGLIALQLHTGPPMKVEFKNIRLKVLKSE